MKYIITILFLAGLHTGLFGQLSFDVLLSSFDGLATGEFREYLAENEFTPVDSQSGMAGSETWRSEGPGNNSEITLVIKTFPWNHLWNEPLRHPGYEEIRNDIIKACEHGGFFGCSEVETWDSYTHPSGLEFRLIEVPESRETGKYFLEVLYK